jgi:hypothetical protein
MTSPGRAAVPDGMFSHNGIAATTWIGSSRRAMPIIVATTAAAPPMSPFIDAIPFDGLSEIPPLRQKAKRSLFLARKTGGRRTGYAAWKE